MLKISRYLSLLLLSAFICLSLFTVNSSTAQAQSSPPTITAKHAYLLDTTTHHRLMKKDASAKVEIASITKVMTALVAIRQGNLDATVTIQQKYPDYVTENGASTAGLKVGDELTVKELLYALMLPSGCDAAYALADELAGNYDDFVAMMNKQATKMGLSQTYFTSVDGLHLPDEEGAFGYSSAYDMVRLSEVAMRYPVFREVVQSTKHVLPENETHQEYTWNNTNTLLVSYDGAIGIKTGTTPGAGPCLLFAATRNGHTLAGIVLNSAGGDQRFTDATTMLDWGFQQISERTDKLNESVELAA